MLEREIDFPVIVQSKEPAIGVIRKDKFAELLAFTVRVTENYLSACYPNQKGIAPIIAADLIETRPTWDVRNMVNLFKFLRQRQDIEGLKVYGNQITVPKIMEMVSIYEDYLAQALEQEKIKGKDKRIMFSEVDEANKERTEKFMEHLKKKFEQKMKVEVAPDESYFVKPR